MKTLVYCGANVGDGLAKIINRYERVVAFEPRPKSYFTLLKRFGLRIIPICAALAEKSGNSPLYEYGHSSSLAVMTCETYKLLGYNYVGSSIFVPTINLYDLISQLDFVDMLVTDIQGMDLTVLRTIEPMLRRKQIGRIQCEQDIKQHYEGLDNFISSHDKFWNDLPYKEVSRVRDACGFQVDVTYQLEG